MKKLFGCIVFLLSLTSCATNDVEIFKKSDQFGPQEHDSLVVIGTTPGTAVKFTSKRNDCIVPLFSYGNDHFIMSTDVKSPGPQYQVFRIPAGEYILSGTPIDDYDTGQSTATWHFTAPPGSVSYLGIYDRRLTSVDRNSDDTMHDAYEFLATYNGILSPLQQAQFTRGPLPRFIMCAP